MAVAVTPLGIEVVLYRILNNINEVNGRPGTVLHINKTQKNPLNLYVSGLASFYVYQSGGADGTRTRDPWRDRPVF